MEIKTGYIPFRNFKTYYRIVTDTHCSKAPVLLLHGGPGSTHNYFKVLDELYKTGHPIISYDQIGCGESYIEGHPELFTLEIWLEELENLRQFLKLDRLHILGQSWGGMLAIAYACERGTKGIESMILSSTLSNAQLWAKEQHRMIGYMSKEDQRIIAHAEATNNFNTAEIKKTIEKYMIDHCANPIDENSPECLRQEKKVGELAYMTAWGPNEFTATGNLKSFNYTEQLKKIKIPVLIISGTDDLCTPLIAKTMYDALPNSQWKLFKNAKHMCFIDCQKQYCQLLCDWLAQKN